MLLVDWILEARQPSDISGIILISEVSHFFGEVNPESIYDAQMFNKKSNDFNRIVKNPFLFNLLISLDIS